MVPERRPGILGQGPECLLGFGRGMPGQDPQMRGELPQFAEPVAQERGRHHQQARPGLGVRGTRPAQTKKGDDLQGFAQTHVVGQTGAQPQSAQTVEPCDAPLLIRPQPGGKTRHRPALGRFAQSLQQNPETLAGHHLRPVPARVQVHLTGAARRRALEPGQPAHPLVEGKRAGLMRGLHLDPVLQHAVELRGVHLHPLAPEIDEPGLRGADLAAFLLGERRAVESHGGLE